MRFWIRKKAFGVTAFFRFDIPLLFLLLLPFQGLPDHTKEGDLLEDFEPEDIHIEPGGTLNIKSGGTIDIQSGSTLNVQSGTTINGVWDFGSATSLAIPSSAAPTTDATAEIALDTSITGHKPLIQYFSGAQSMTVVALPTANIDTTNGDVIKYDATAQEFKMEPDATGGGGGGSTDLEGAYHTDTVGDAQITIDTRDISLNLSDSTNDFKVSIDNTTTGEVTTALEVTTSGAGATIVDAIDLSDADITHALSLGENRIKGTYFNWDGGSQLALGNNGTGIITLQGGGGIDTTGNGDLKLVPHGTGIIDIPTGITFRLPQASPVENKNGLYWDAATNKLCIDKDSDLCTSALGGAAATGLDSAYDNGPFITVDAADVDFNLANATNDYKFSIDNTSGGEISTAMDITTSSTGSTFVTALDLSDADITHALSLGENRIKGTYFNWDGGSQLALGNNGTGIITLQGGGGIDTTGNGDLKLAPHGTGIIDIPTGITFRLPQASPVENKNGLYWDAANNRLCIDKNPDLCVTLTLASLNLDNDQAKTLSDLIKHKEGIEKLTLLISNPQKIEKIALLSKNPEIWGLTDEEKKKLGTIERIPKGEIRTGSTRSFDRGSAGLVNGEIFVELHSLFVKTIEGSSTPQYYIQITPTSTDVKGPLVVLKEESGFRVIDIGGKTNATFDWEARAHFQEN